MVDPAWMATDLADVIAIAQDLLADLPDAHEAAYTARSGSSETSMVGGRYLAESDPTGNAVISKAGARRSLRDAAKAIDHARRLLIDARADVHDALFS